MTPQALRDMLQDAAADLSLLQKLRYYGDVLDVVLTLIRDVTADLSLDAT
jgi:hypothetical protein